MAYTALLQAAPLPHCDAWGEGSKGEGVTSPQSWRGDSTQGGWQHILHKVSAGGTDFVM